MINFYVYRSLSWSQGDDPDAGAMSARFDGKGTRLLCSEIQQPLVYYNVPTLKQPTAHGRTILSAQGYNMQEVSQRNLNLLTIKSPCCFAGDEDELITGASNDNGIYIWSASNGEDHRIEIDRPLHVLGGHRETVRSVRYNVHRSILASCDDEGIVKLWATEVL